MISFMLIMAALIVAFTQAFDMLCCRIEARLRKKHRINQVNIARENMKKNRLVASYKNSHEINSTI